MFLSLSPHSRTRVLMRALSRVALPIASLKASSFVHRTFNAPMISAFFASSAALSRCARISAHAPATPCGKNQDTAPASNYLRALMIAALLRFWFSSLRLLIAYFLRQLILPKLLEHVCIHCVHMSMRNLANSPRDSTVVPSPTRRHEPRSGMRRGRA
jgi:hypothetical protein